MENHTKGIQYLRWGERISSNTFLSSGLMKPAGGSSESLAPARVALHSYIPEEIFGNVGNNRAVRTLKLELNAKRKLMTEMCFFPQTIIWSSLGLMLQAKE